MTEHNIAYFNREKNRKNPIFFNRFPDIKFEGAKVLDLGCGHGAISIDLALKGAKRIVGVDLDNERIEFARENLKINYPQFSGQVSFECAELKDLKENDFDIIISKATFEHIIGLDTFILDIKNKLRIGGILVTGFGPLYNSPWGDHNRLKHALPWTHLIFSQKHFIDKLNKKREHKVANIYDLGLNGYSLKKYKSVFYNTEGLSVIDFRTNVSHKASMKFFDLFAKIPFLKEYFTYNIYAVLKRTA